MGSGGTMTHLMEFINQYLDKWHDHFDLLDHEMPFMVARPFVAVSTEWRRSSRILLRTESLRVPQRRIAEGTRMPRRAIGLFMSSVSIPRE